jgi:ATP-dependent exoDNAse (exonuclease V) beta subunit
LFAVGDPMQSIYQFREAEVGLFLRARDEGIGGLALEFLELRRNFRSLPAVVEWVNAACSQVFPAADDPWLAAIRYLHALPGLTGEGGGVCVHPLAGDDPAEEAARIATLALAERARAPACSIAVLVPARRHAEPIARALRAAGLGVRGVKLEPLGERPVVRDLAALTRALLHAADRTAWLALLRAPWCGLSLPELQQLAGDPGLLVWARLHDEAILARLGPATRQRLLRVRAALAPALEAGERGLPLWQRVEQCWLRLGGPACCAGGADLADAETYLRALGEQRPGGLLPGEAAEELVAELYAAAEGEAGAVEILTMHAAKGLEWDVVFLPAAGRAGRSDDEPLLHWLDLPLAGGQGLLMAPIRAAGRAGKRSLGGYIAHVKLERRRIERARLLYVAATRARHSLHWLGHAAVDASTGEAMPTAHTLLALLWPVVGAQFAAAAAAAQPAGTAGDVAGPVAAAASDVVGAEEAALWRLPGNWSPGGLPPPVACERLPLSLRLPGEQPEYDWVGLAARAVGTVVHAELQRLAGLAALPEPSQLRAADYLPWLAEHGVPDSQAPEAAARIVAALAGTLRDARGRWLLAAQGREAWSEMRLSGLHDGRVVNISIDRMLVDEQGDRWIIDFKTSTHEGGDREAFLELQAGRYAPQLQRYAAIAGALWPGRMRAALYFPLLGEFRELPLA